MSKNTDLSELINYVKGKTTGQLVAPSYTSASSFTGTIAGYLGFDSSGNILTSTAVASQWTTSGLNIYYNIGNVGINTTSPSQKLDVNGAIKTSGNLFAVNNTPFSTNGTITVHDTVGLVLKGITSFTFDFSIYSPGTVGSVLMANPTGTTNIIFPSGNVGIGLSAPAYKLDVVGDINITGSFRVNGTPIGTGGGGVSGSGTTNYLSKWSSSTGITNSQIFDNGSQIGFKTNSPYYGFDYQLATSIRLGYFIGSIDGTDNAPAFIAHNGTGIVSGTIPMGYSASKFVWYIATEEAFRVTASRQLLVGTSSGVTGGGIMQVNGDVNISGSFKINGTAIGGGGGNMSGSGSAGYFAKFDSSNYIVNSALFDVGFNVWLNSTGYTLIGAPSKGYHVYDTTSAGITFKTNSSNYGAYVKRTQANNTMDIYNDVFLNIGANTNSNAIFVSGSGVSLGSTTLDSGYGLQLINNSGQKAKAFAWDTYSDQRIKKDVVDLNYGLNEVMKLRPVRYNQYDSLITNNQILLTDSYKETIGFIAQDVHEVVHEAVTKGSQSELWGMDYNKLVPVLVKSIQDQQGEIETLKKQIAILRNDLC
jgi:hypothetical protein